MSQQKIQLMISSRCKIKFPPESDNGIELSEIRKQLKDQIETENYFGNSLVTVWINEEETESGSDTAWDACIKQAADCDIFISLVDGEAGWQKDKSGIGICHAEFKTAYINSPDKVRVISLIGDIKVEENKNGPDTEFLHELTHANLLEARNIGSSDELIMRTKDVVREMILQLAHKGAREVKKSGPNTGEALEWSRLNFDQREKEMVNVLVTSLSAKEKAEWVDEKLIAVPVSDFKVLFRPSAVPAAFSVSAARERVGQPFLKDHEISRHLNSKVGGPVHVIACHKNVTEAQAMSLLGFPDATIVSGAFGIYVSDNIQKIQLCFITYCRDSASTKHGLQKLFDWLERTGEDKLLAKRATSRTKILAAISEELN